MITCCRAGLRDLVWRNCAILLRAYCSGQWQLGWGRWRRSKVRWACSSAHFLWAPGSVDVIKVCRSQCSSRGAIDIIINLTVTGCTASPHCKCGGDSMPRSTVTWIYCSIAQLHLNEESVGSSYNPERLARALQPFWSRQMGHEKIWFSFASRCWNTSTLVLLKFRNAILNCG